MKITYTIPDEKTDEFKTAFLKACPVPLDEEDKPIMSIGAWIKHWGKEQFLAAYREGKRKAATEAIVIDEDLIE